MNNIGASKSIIKGYIASLDDGSILYQDGLDVYRAAKGNVVDCVTGYLIGQWECSLARWNCHAHVIYGLPALGENNLGV